MSNRFSIKCSNIFPVPKTSPKPIIVPAILGLANGNPNFPIKSKLWYIIDIKYVVDIIKIDKNVKIIKFLRIFFENTKML